MEELQAVLNDFNRQKNTTPNEDFHGLSSEQMHRFLHFPFETPDLVRYSDQIAVDAENHLQRPLAGIIWVFLKDMNKKAFAAKMNLYDEKYGEFAALFCKIPPEEYDNVIEYLSMLQTLENDFPGILSEPIEDDKEIGRASCWERV